MISQDELESRAFNDEETKNIFKELQSYFKDVISSLAPKEPLEDEESLLPSKKEEEEKEKEKFSIPFNNNDEEDFRALENSNREILSSLSKRYMPSPKLSRRKKKLSRFQNPKDISDQVRTTSISAELEKQSNTLLAYPQGFLQNRDSSKFLRGLSTPSISASQISGGATPTGTLLPKGKIPFIAPKIKRR